MFILMIVMVQDEFNMWLVGYYLDRVKRKLSRGTCVYNIIVLCVMQGGFFMGILFLY